MGKGDKTRADIVVVARRLFYERGYDATSFSHIVEASGLQRGNIYHYFKTKDAMLEAVVDQRVAEVRQLLTQWEASQPDARARLHAFAAMVAGERADLVDYGCPIGSLNTELGKGRRDLQAAARRLFDLFRDWLAARFTELGRGADAEALALHLLGRAQGIALIAHVYRDESLLLREIRLLEQWIDAQ